GGDWRESSSRAGSLRSLQAQSSQRTLHGSLYKGIWFRGQVTGKRWK
ncbi:MAG: hypothetical protein IH586_13555, partial [Anaerolineaceae bacterium]|nr:hypothetical protein [Anaerolineaceae bacterium]